MLGKSLAHRCFRTSTCRRSRCTLLESATTLPSTTLESFARSFAIRTISSKHQCVCRSIAKVNFSAKSTFSLRQVWIVRTAGIPSEEHTSFRVSLAMRRTVSRPARRYTGLAGQASEVPCACPQPQFCVPWPLLTSYTCGNAQIRKLIRGSLIIVMSMKQLPSKEATYGYPDKQQDNGKARLPKRFSRR